VKDKGQVTHSDNYDDDYYYDCKNYDFYFALLRYDAAYIVNSLTTFRDLYR
jgi:hypothetical protein